MVVGLLLNIVLMPFIVSHLGVANFAIWVLANALVGYAGLLDVGLTPTLMRKSAEHLARGEKQELNQLGGTILTVFLLIGLLIGVSAFGLGSWLAGAFNIPRDSAEKFVIVIRIVGVQAGIGFPMSVWSGLMAGMQDFHILNGFAAAAGIIRAVGAVALLKLGFGLEGLVWLGFSVALAMWIANGAWVFFRMPDLRIAFRLPSKEQLLDLVKNSGPMFLSSAAGRMIHGADRVIIGLFLPVSSITFYEVGARISDYTRNVLYSALVAAIPTAAEINAAGDAVRLARLYVVGTRYLLMVSGAVTVFLFLFGRKFIHLWMGKEFESSAWILYLLMAGNLYQAQNVIAHAILIGTGRLRAYTFAMAAYPVLKVALSVFLILHWGLIGVALATPLTVVAVETFFIPYMASMMHVRGLDLFRKWYVPFLLSAVTSSGLILLLRANSIIGLRSWSTLLVGSGLFFSVFAGSFVLFGMSHGERTGFKATLFNAFGWGRS
jgi:O-antigen/teichoic acid export membrane protein